jgi:predicted phosphodiesterase
MEKSSETRYSKVLKVLEYAEKNQMSIREAALQLEESDRLVKDYIYDVVNHRIDLAPHLKGRLLIFYDRVKSKQAEEVVKKTDELFEKGKAVLKKLAGKTVPLDDLANMLNASPIRTQEVVERLKEEGYTAKVVKSSSDKHAVFSREVGITTQLEPVERFGALGDTHLGSKYERLDLLHQAYDRFNELEITTVFHTGNWIDGEARFNFNDLHTHGLDNQINYFIEHYPRVEGITTYYISGDDHEGWYEQRLGINIGKYLENKAQEAGRDDLIFLGAMEADVLLGNTKVRILHPGGGSAYAISYTSQKIVESYAEHEKPDILLHGHYHKFEYLYLRGIHIYQTGCLEEQTPFMRKKRLSAHLGCWVIEPMVNSEGRVVETIQRPITFQQGQWSYKH